MALVRIDQRAMRQLMTSGEWQAHLMRAGNVIAKGTAANADMTTYKRSLEVQLRTEGGEAICRVGTDDPFAHLDEWGSINNFATGAMRRAVEATGMEAEFS